MTEGRDDGHRAEHHVEPFEQGGPGGTQTRPLAVHPQPALVGQAVHLVLVADAHGGADHAGAELPHPVDVDVRAGGAVHQRARSLGGVDRSVECGGHRRIALQSRLVDPRGDAQAGQAGDVGVRQVQSPGGGRRAVWAGQDVQQQAQIGGAAGDRAERVHVALHRPAAGFIEISECGDDAEARLVAVHPAEGRRHPHRTADVGTQLEAGHAARDRGGRSPAGPARRAVRGPRVVGGAEHLVVALPIAAPFRQVRLAEHDGARCLQPGDGGSVRWRDAVGQHGGTAGGADALGVDGVLHRDRQAVQRPPPLATGRCGIGRATPGAGAVRVQRADGVHRWVDVVDAGQEQVQQFLAAQPPFPDGRRLLRRAPQCRVTGPIVHTPDPTQVGVHVRSYRISPPTCHPPAASWRSRAVVPHLTANLRE